MGGAGCGFGEVSSEADVLLTYSFFHSDDTLAET